jgi:hypothetical protein
VRVRHPSSPHSPKQMHRLALALLLAAALPAAAAAQPSPLQGVRISAPPGYTAAAPLSDSVTQVFTQPQSAVAVAALPAATERAAVIQRLRGVLAGVVAGPGAGTLEWRMLTSAPASAFDVYHERWIGYDGRKAVIADVHHLRKDGRDVLLATSFLTQDARAEQMLQSGFGFVSHAATDRAVGHLLTELVGDPPLTEADSGIVVSREDFVGVGGEDAALPPLPPHPEEAAVRAAFEAYRAALLARDGDAALLHVSEATFEYYGEVQRMALYATADEVRARPLPDQLYVLMLRTRIPTERLRAMTPRELFAHGVVQGWIGEESTRTMQVGRIHVDGGRASAPVLQEGRPSPLHLHFVRQDGAWRWDMLGVIQLMDPLFRQLAEAGGATPEALLLQVVEGVAKRRLPPTVWDPPLEK